MKENTLNLLMILVGGFIIDLGFLYLSATKSKSLTMILLGLIIFWNGFSKLT